MSTEIIKSKIQGLETRFNKAESGLNFEREQSFALQIIHGNSQLQKCELASLQKAVYNVALTGLSLNPTLAYAYLVPRGNKAVLDVSYRGFIKIVTDLGSVTSIKAVCVYENDEFYHEEGLEPILKHRPIMQDRGEIIGVYSIAKLANGGSDFIVLPKEEVEKVKNYSQSKNSKHSPWQTMEGEMYKKTAIKRHIKTLPHSEAPERMAAVMDLDNHNAGFDFSNKKTEDFSGIVDDIEEIEALEEQEYAEDQQKDDKPAKNPKVKADKDGQTSIV